MTLAKLISYFWLFAPPVVVIAIWYRRQARPAVASTMLGKVCETSGDVTYGFFRLGMILFAYLLAACASGFLLAGFRILSHEPSAGDLGALFIYTLIASLYMILLLVGPVAVIVVIAEIAGIRTPLYYGLAWGLTSLMWEFNSRPWAQPSQIVTDGMTVALIISNCVAGLVYWRLAGRFTLPRPKAEEKASRVALLPDRFRNLYRRP